MSVDREGLLIVGFRFGEEFTEELKRKEKNGQDFLEHIYSHEYNPNGRLVIDRMMSNYTFFGVVKRISDGWDVHKDEIVEMDSLTDRDVYNLKEEFYELFGNEDDDLPYLSIFYLPHYT